MSRKHRSSSNPIKLMEHQKGIGRDDIQITDNRLTFMPYEPNGTCATNRHTHRMPRRLHGVQVERMCGLKGGQK